MPALTPEQLQAAFGSRASMEEGDITINVDADTASDDPVADVPVEEVLDTSDTPEAAELDVQEQGEVVEDAIDDAQEVNESIDGLENLYIRLCQFSNEGLELGSAGAQLLQDHVNVLVGKYNLTCEHVGVASVEDFTLFNDSSITSSMEGIGETLKAAWKKFIEILKNIWFAIANFVKSLFDQVGATKDKIKRLREVIKAKPKTRGGEITAPGILGGKVNDERIKNLIDVTNTFYSVKYTQLLEVFGNFDATHDDAQNAINSVANSLRSVEGKLCAGGLTYTYNKEDCTATVKREGEQKAGKVSAFSIADCTKYLNIAGSIIDGAEKYNSVKAQRKALNDNMIRKLEQNATKISDNMDKDGKKEAKQFNSTSTRMGVTAWGSFTRAEQTFIRASVSVANALTNMVAASLGESKEDKEAAKKAKAAAKK